MRPINLIPSEQRHGSQSPLRTGYLPYVVVAALVFLLAGLALLISSSNKISERKDEIVTLERENADAQQRAQELASYVQLAELRQARMATINSLADSRFDWVRVMRELSKILPGDVWLTSLDASASSASATSSAESSGSSSGANLRAAISGPALELSGCAKGQEGVAGFVTALKEIDGVTRVGVQSSGLPSEGSSAESSGGGGGEEGSATDCRTRSFIAQFQIVIAFDAAPVPVTAEAVEATAVEAAPEEGSSEETTPEG
jgi:Tfp pilus assembly protein PilN